MPACVYNIESNQIIEQVIEIGEADYLFCNIENLTPLLEGQFIFSVLIEEIPVDASDAPIKQKKVLVI